MVFKAAKMVARLEKEGRAHLIDDETKETMKQLDGKEVMKDHYKALIYGEEEYYVRLGDEYYPVNKLDCE